MLEKLIISIILGFLITKLIIFIYRKVQNNTYYDCTDDLINPYGKIKIKDTVLIYVIKKDFLGRTNTYFYKNRDCDQEPLFSMNSNLEKALETDEEAIMKMLEFLVEMTEKLEND